MVVVVVVFVDSLSSCPMSAFISSIIRKIRFLSASKSPLKSNKSPKSHDVGHNSKYCINGWWSLDVDVEEVIHVFMLLDNDVKSTELL